MDFQRNTRQRQVILEELRGLTSHPTARVLYDIVRRRLPRISLGTVYRNLELLAKMELVQKLEIIGSEACFDGNPARHHHIRCVSCGRVDDFPDAPNGAATARFGKAGGYEILGYRLEYFGVCPECRNQRDRSIVERNDDHAKPKDSGRI